MNHIPCSYLALAAALLPLAQAQTPPTIGNLFVVRVGDGTTAQTNAATATFVDEFTPAGALVQSFALPVAASGLNQPCTNSGTATSEGFLTISSDGLYLLLGGYAAIPGTATIATSASATAPRVIARIDLAGNLDTTTALTDAFDGGNLRSVASDDGNRFWITGSNEAMRFVANLGATSSTVIGTSPANMRVANVYDQQLYSSANSGAFRNVFTVGSGLPTTSGAVSTLLPGLPSVTGQSVYDFHFANPTTLYTADDNTNGQGGIRKWTYDGLTATWTLQYVLAPGATSGCRGLTGYTQNGVTTLWATVNTQGSTSSSVQSIVDVGAGSLFQPFVPAPTNAAYRGIRLLAKPTTLTRIPASCGAMGIRATGNAEIGTEVTVTLTNSFAGLGYVGFGLVPSFLPFCNCTLLHDWQLIYPGLQITVTVPFNPGFIGVPVFIQGLDLFAPGGCPDPTLTLTDGFSAILQ